MISGITTVNYSEQNSTFKFYNISNTIIFNLNFDFGYFDNFQVMLKVYYNNTIPMTNYMPISSLCGWHCKNCSINNPDQCLECFNSTITTYFLYYKKS
jgi:hypothetical protein